MTQNPTTNTEAGAVADVAAKLTEAQRAAISAASGARLGTRSPTAMKSRRSTCEALVGKGLFWRGSNRWTGQATYGPTDAGLAVRHHLEQGATAGEVAAGAADHTITAKGAQP